MNILRFPVNTIFRRYKGDYMVRNHYISDIHSFSSALFCPIRNTLVPKFSSHKNKEKCNKVHKVNHIRSIYKKLPASNAKVNVWTNFFLYESKENSKFSIPLVIYRNNFVCDDRNNIFEKTEVGITEKNMYRVPVHCALQIKNVLFKLLGVTIHKDGEDIPVIPQKTLHILSVSISRKYGSNYLCGSESGTGIYLERHCTPHLYRPNSVLSGGAVIMAKEVSFCDNGCIKHSFELFAVKIPENHTLLIPPFTWHNDCFLYGTYQVGYGIASSYETISLATRLGFIRG